MNGVISSLLLSLTALGTVEPSNWPTGFAGPATDVAAARLGGWYAAASTAEDSVEIRDVRGELIRTIERAELQTLAPWMTLDGSADGPSALAWTDSGYRLHIVLHDDRPAGDAQPGDAVLVWDWLSDTVAVFARADISDDTVAPVIDAEYSRSRLHLSSGSVLQTFSAGPRLTTGALLSSVGLGAPINAIAVDSASQALFAATDSALFRSDLTHLPQFTSLGPLTGVRGMAWSEHFGSLGPALYATQELSPGLVRLCRVPEPQADGLLALAPQSVLTDTGGAGELDATACGRLITATPIGADLLEDSQDPRLGFEDWLLDEVRQQVVYARSLISPDGEPDGFVIDAQAALGGTRFHPASPDAAAWVVLMLITADAVDRDTEARADARRILTRYAGLATDGFSPGRSAGIFRHWIDPFSQTGAAKPGWNNEFATMSTMKIALAADRAAAYWPSDSAIIAARDAIVGGVGSWERFLRRTDGALYLKALPNGQPDTSSGLRAFHEGIMYVEQAAEYDGPFGQSVFADWLDRSNWPSSSYISGEPMSSNAQGFFMPAFVSLYGMLVQEPMRTDPAWQRQIDVLSASSGAWTDENAPTLMTVFSAGTTKGEWGGYNADSLGDNPGDVTALNSLMAFAGRGRTHEAIGAYNAYRRGARQSFASGAAGTGATMLYRRSDVDPGYLPNTAGAPDVILGGLGLAELIQPGVLERVIAIEFGGARCISDLTTGGANPGDAGFGVPDGASNTADLTYFVERWLAQDAYDTDMTTDGANPGDTGFGVPDGIVNTADLTYYVERWLNGCP
ncbi:MAG: GC-type dockerin domain-anchored protein [Planctomycetota bacterium]